MVVRCEAASLRSWKAGRPHRTRRYRVAYPRRPGDMRPEHDTISRFTENGSFSVTVLEPLLRAGASPDPCGHAGAARPGTGRFRSRQRSRGRRTGSGALHRSALRWGPGRAWPADRTHDPRHAGPGLPLGGAALRRGPIWLRPSRVGGPPPARRAQRLARAGASAGQNRCVRRVGTKQAWHEGSAHRCTTPWRLTWSRCQ